MLKRDDGVERKKKERDDMALCMRLRLRLTAIVSVTERPQGNQDAIKGNRCHSSEEQSWSSGGGAKRREEGRKEKETRKSRTRAGRGSGHEARKTGWCGGCAVHSEG